MKYFVEVKKIQGSKLKIVGIQQQVIDRLPVPPPVYGGDECRLISQESFEILSIFDGNIPKAKEVINNLDKWLC